MGTRKSTTPKADEIAALYRKYDALCEFKDVYNDEVDRIRCKDCGGRFRYVMSAYAMSKDSGETLVHCDCKKRLVWLNIKFRGQEK